MDHKYTKSSSFNVELEEKSDGRIWKSFETKSVAISILQSRVKSNF